MFTTSPVKFVVAQTTFGSHKIQIRNLDHELTLNNAIRDFRLSNGLGATRNPYSWWKYVLVAATYFDRPVTFGEIITELNQVGIVISNTYSSLLGRSVEGDAPSPVQREYSKGLPVLTRKLGLKGKARRKTGSVGREALQFQYTNTSTARTKLIEAHPETALLFVQLDKQFKARSGGAIGTVFFQG